MHKFIKKSVLFLLNLLLLFALVAFLGGCGGSQGDDGGSNTTTTGEASITLSVPSSVTFETPVTVRATLRDANGALVPSAVVTFAASSSIVTFSPTSATALTNPSGVASILLNAASYDSEGATSITASAIVASSGTSTTVASMPVGIAVNGATVTLGVLIVGSSPISAYGTSSVSVPVLISGSPAHVPIAVTFSSLCVSAEKATLTSPVTTNTVTGIASSTYTDNNCNAGTDTITASVTGGGTASATIIVIPPATSNMQFVSATPEIIATQTVGSASLPKNSLVKFKVVDNNNQAKSGVVVDFSLIANTLVGGLSIEPLSATSNFDGYVTTSVTSGTVPTPVWVVATVHGSSPVISSQSSKLTITTGLPTQNSFSLSLQTVNIEGLDYDGTGTTLTISGADRLGNPVPEGTAINFITPESGVIDPASCTTSSSGNCSVTYKSLGNRPTDGRVTVVAYAVGEMSFIDGNGNNSYELGETFYDLGSLYVDNNENMTWDTEEQFYAPYGGSAGSSPCQTRPAGTALPPGYANVQSKENTCSAIWGINYVRRSAVVVLSGSAAYITPTNADMADNCTHTFSLTLTDVNGNAMPAGTTVTVSDSEVYYIPNHLPAEPAVVTQVESVSITGGSPVQNTTSDAGSTILLKVKAGTSCLAGTPDHYPYGTADIKVVTPKGNTTTITIGIMGNSISP